MTWPMTFVSPPATPVDPRTVVQLQTGANIPRVGLGVWQSGRGLSTQNAVSTALRVGYRHVDTARIYGNEADVGIAIRETMRESGLPRGEIFVTTKLWNDDQGYDQALRAFDGSLARLGLDYVDLFLVHWPVPAKRLESWRALEAIFASKRARAIGVSNFLVPHLEELLGVCKVPPAVDQIEVTPFLQQRATREFCAKRGIAVEAYSPLTRGERLDDATLATVARSVHRTPAQVLLRWGVQHGLIVLPKSTREARIRENGAIFDFELDGASMALLDGLEEGLVTGWDPRMQG